MLPKPLLPPPTNTSGIEFQRPLSSTWTATLGGHAQRTTCINERGARLTHDAYGSPLTVSGRPDEFAVVTTLSTSYVSIQPPYNHLINTIQQSYNHH